jgi:hypothetical protein
MGARIVAVMRTIDGARIIAVMRSPPFRPPYTATTAAAETDPFAPGDLSR